MQGELWDSRRGQCKWAGAAGTARPRHGGMSSMQCERTPRGRFEPSDGRSVTLAVGGEDELRVLRDVLADEAQQWELPPLSPLDVADNARSLRETRAALTALEQGSVTMGHAWLHALLVMAAED